MFNFYQLIKRFSKGLVTYSENRGYYDYKDGGKWKNKATNNIPIEPAAIVPLSKEETKHTEGGQHTVGDMKLYCYKTLNPGGEITHIFDDSRTKVYKILEHRDYSNFDKGLTDKEGIHIYTLRRIGNDKNY